MTRKEAREQAFVFVFEKIFNNEPVQSLIDYAVESRAFEPDNDGYILKSVNGVCDNIEKIDKAISENLSDDWKIDRISKVSLAVLRLSIFEILFMEDIPAGVSINEAVEIAKKYSGETDGAFVNGVLSSVNKTQKNEL